MILPIVTFPNEVLRTPAKPITFPLSPEIKQLMEDMLDTVHVADGIGLAAPQVGKSVQLVVINLEKNNLAPFFLFNPRIEEPSKELAEIEEGCLSIPGVFGMVTRPKQVTIVAQREDGTEVRLVDDGWVARVAQHEIDHLRGTLILELITRYTKGKRQVDAWKKSGVI